MSVKEKFQSFKENIQSKLPKRKVKPSYQKTNVSIVSLTLLAVFTALLASSALIAAPQIEKIIPNVKYDLNLTSNETRKDYRISSPENDTNKLNSDINIIKSKLNKMGFYNITVSNFTQVENPDTKEKTTDFTISVQSSKDMSYADRLVADRSKFQLMTPKSTLDPSNTEKQIDSMLPENYDVTRFSNSDLRNIQVQNLKDSSGTYSYFAIFKAYPQQAKDINAFLTENNGKYIGVGFGEYVIPKKLQSEQLSNLFIFLTQDEKEAQFYTVVLNSGVIQSKLEMKEQTDETPVTFSVNIYYALAFILAFGVVISAMIFFFKGRNIRRTLSLFASYLFTVTIFISIYKLSENSFTLWTFPIATIIFGLILYINSYYFTFAVFAIDLLLGWLLLGIDNPLVMQIADLGLLGVAVSYIFDLYVSNLKKAIKK